MRIEQTNDKKEKEIANQTREYVEQIQIRKEKEVEIIGKHVYGNLYSISPALLTGIDFLSKKIEEAARAGNAHIIEIITKKFPDINGYEGGVSVIALLEESHIALHTWPEGAYATLDVYTCGKEADPQKIFDYMTNVLKPAHFDSYTADRSHNE
ncbi:MAG: adenosylmethionine decarboxylase [Candidatus Micrarchaeia archaeon]